MSFRLNRSAAPKSLSRCVLAPILLLSCACRRQVPQWAGPHRKIQVEDSFIAGWKPLQVALFAGIAEQQDLGHYGVKQPSLPAHPLDTHTHTHRRAPVALQAWPSFPTDQPVAWVSNVDSSGKEPHRSLFTLRGLVGTRRDPHSRSTLQGTHPRCGTATAAVSGSTSSFGSTGVYPFLKARLYGTELAVGGFWDPQSGAFLGCPSSPQRKAGLEGCMYPIRG